jgi:hypothetical protein
MIQSDKGMVPAPEVECPTNQQCILMNGQKTPGMCMNKNIPEVPSSYAPNSCTHQRFANNIQLFTSICMNANKDKCHQLDFCQWNGDVVDCPNPNTPMDAGQCGASSTANPAAGTTNQPSTTGSTATSTGGQLYPFWNTKQCVWSCPVMPTTAPDTCTHTAVDMTNQVKVNLCSKLSNQKVCQEDGCTWNLPKPIAPSKAPSTCTHFDTETQNTNRITQCQKYAKQQDCDQ